VILRSLTIAAVAWASLPKRARKMAVDRLLEGAKQSRAWAGDSISAGTPRRWHLQDAAALDAAVELLRAADSVPKAEKAWCNDEHKGVYCSLRQGHRGRHEEWVGDGLESFWPRKPAKKTGRT
jgi:hypothetical protein